ncbi:MAG: DUF2235 domain-containing protein [Pseudomonadota bacterium]
MRLLRWYWRQERTHRAPRRGPMDHVVIFDGTLSTLIPGCETNAGLTYKLLAGQVGAGKMTVYYEAGVQWPDWRHTMDVIEGKGINRMIRRAYGVLATRYRPGDRIFLLGYSRGAYGVRSLAGVIDRVGLLRREHATQRMIDAAYRHYQLTPDGPYAAEFAERYCHLNVPIEMVGVWDTVKALGLRFPLLWRLTEGGHAFHNHALGPSVLHGFHALALDERRDAFQPVLWDTPDDHPGRVEQVWFRGAHGDVGGQLAGFFEARALSNIPLVWMLSRAEALGLDLPAGWRDRFATNPGAPASGMNRRWGKLFLLRSRRRPGRDGSERLHPTAASHVAAARLPIYLDPLAREGAATAYPSSALKRSTLPIEKDAGPKKRRRGKALPPPQATFSNANANANSGASPKA